MASAIGELLHLAPDFMCRQSARHGNRRSPLGVNTSAFSATADGATGR